MKILLIGEYSRLHNSLKEGLLELNYKAYIKGFNDGFKNYDIDFKLQKKWDDGIRRKIKIGIYKLTSFDISSYLTYRQFFKNKGHFINFDIVQLVNENSFYCQPYFEKKILKFLFKKNKKVFLLSCGLDYLNVKYIFEHPEEKSIILPYLLGKVKKNNFLNVLKFRKKSFERLHDYIFKHISGVIASDFDYHSPLKDNSKYLGLIPNPINTKTLKFETLVISNKIVIFLGINNESYFKKGSDYFEDALKIIEKKYSDKVDIVITRSVPYAEYINLYNSCHILLDQVHALDQGYNALEAMAKGKVVFTGAESEFYEYYKLSEQVCINAKPNLNYLVNELSFLIENPQEIIEIGRRAREFIEKEHDYIKVAQKYINIWNY